MQDGDHRISSIGGTLYFPAVILAGHDNALDMAPLRLTGDR
jgi:hypothetical protein